MSRKLDFVDLACFDWGATRRELLGLRDPLLAQGYIGALRCSLGRRRDLHAGTRSEGRLEQFFPETYTGLALEVNAAFRQLPPPLKEIMDAHYVIEKPRSRAQRAERMGLSPRAYWARVARARDFVSGYLAASGGERA